MFTITSSAVEMTKSLCRKFCHNLQRSITLLFCMGNSRSFFLEVESSLAMLARKPSRRLSAQGVAAEIEDDEVGCRIEGLETQIQERDDSIRSLTASLNDATVWGRGINRKGNIKR